MRNTIFIALILAAAMMRTTSLQAANADDGKKLFISHCSSCHMIGQRLVGPALKDVYKSQSEDWIISFVHSPVKKINSGDTTAANLAKRFAPIIMPDQVDLNDNQIRDIIAYVKAQSEMIATAAPAAAPVVASTAAASGYAPVTWLDYWFWCGLATLIALLLYGLVILERAYKAKQDYLLSKNK